MPNKHKNIFLAPQRIEFSKKKKWVIVEIWSWARYDIYKSWKENKYLLRSNYIFINTAAIFMGSNYVKDKTLSITSGKLRTFWFGNMGSGKKLCMDFKEARGE